VVRASEVRKRIAVSRQGYTDVFRRAIECSGRITGDPEVGGQAKLMENAPYSLLWHRVIVRNLGSIRLSQEPGADTHDLLDPVFRTGKRQILRLS
jgi:hypothetical protein